MIKRTKIRNYQKESEMADIVIPDTIEGIRDALINHIVDNKEKFKTLWEHVHEIKKHEEKEMAGETINVGADGNMNAAMMAMMGQGGLGGNGLLTGVLLASLLRGNGLFGGPGGGDAAIIPQSQANMSIMSALGDIKQAVAVSTAQMETSQALQSSTIQSQLSGVAAALTNTTNGVKDAVNANSVVLMQQLNGLEKSVMENRYELAKDITNDGDKTRALITSQYEATLNRQLGEANAAIIELRSQNALNERARGIEVTTTNNINQAQSQQQQQQQWGHLAGLVSNLANDLQYIRATNQAINVGSGTLTANPANTNTNIR